MKAAILAALLCLLWPGQEEVGCPLYVVPVKPTEAHGDHLTQCQALALGSPVLQLDTSASI